MGKIILKTGIKIRIGSFDKDLSECTDDEIRYWLELLDDEAKIRTVTALVHKVHCCVLSMGKTEA